MISKNIVKLIRSLDSKKNRRKESLFVAEGPKVVGDLIEWQSPTLIVATSEWLHINMQRLVKARVSNGNQCRIFEVTDEELNKASLLMHPQQVIALFPIPDERNLDIDEINSTLSIALDGVQDPGNLGTIIRIADWFGIKNIICSADTADAYNPKVVQATMGSIARVNIVYTDIKLLLDNLSDDLPVYGTLLDGTNIYTQQLSTNGIIIMGNEGNGISPQVRKRITRRLLIPDFNDNSTADSLNVAIATAITCSEFRRRTLA